MPTLVVTPDPEMIADAGALLILPNRMGLPLDPVTHSWWFVGLIEFQQTTHHTLIRLERLDALSADSADATVQALWLLLGENVYRRVFNGTPYSRRRELQVTQAEYDWIVQIIVAAKRAPAGLTI